MSETTRELHSFEWLHANYPEAHAQFLDTNGGDAAVAAENWRRIQTDIHQTSFEQQVADERRRCIEHVDLAVLAGDACLALPGVQSGEPADKWGDYYLEHAGRGRELRRGEETFNTLGRPLAVALVNAALRKEVSNAN